MRLTEKLALVREEGKALLAANFYNYETCKGIIEAAAVLEQPVILQLTPKSIAYMGLSTAVAIGKTLAASHGVEAWLHLDHCKEVELVKKCLDANFDSVMIDASAQPFRENIAITRQVVEMAKNYNVNVEAELGAVPLPDGELDTASFTLPEEAREFVEATGASSLAVAIGSKHGFYKGEPKLDLERLEAIRNATDAFLVLHGGSGIPVPLVQQAIQRGICKINVATETKDTFMRSLRNLMGTATDIDLRTVFPPATAEVSKIISGKLRMVSMLGN